MDRQIIQPRTLKGFTDVLPTAGQYRRRMLRVIEETFCSFGFDPIQTPNVEYAEILKGKGGGDNDKQMFEFRDAGGRDVALRFDLTVPLARFVAQHGPRLTMPLRAYNIGYVFRGDRPQKGRYREFLQCDADIIGETDVSADAEILAIAQAALTRMDFGRFVVRVNNRRMVNGLLNGLDLGDRITPVLRALDKIDKIGPAGVTAELAQVEVDAAVVERILAVLAARGETNEATFAAVADLVDSAEAEAGLEELRTILDLVVAAGGDPDVVRFDPSIVRGLDYYTGMVYEIGFVEAPEVGSVGGGGRYDNLTGLYTRSRFPGVGGTIGVTRLMSALESLGRIRDAERQRPLVVVTRGNQEDQIADARLAASVRETGLFDVDLYPGAARHAAQMKYADGRGAMFVLTLDDPTTVSVKELRSGDRTSIAVEQVADLLPKLAGISRS
ncbi:histidine--tRNA ligase [Micromonospora maritima]|uniref:Histidine--tRNA ligase n=1 Tax=Micromonospora maritima TaxID=986711 RepID=A0ABW7ZF94_9ACTN